MLSAVLTRAFAEAGDRSFKSFTDELKRIAGLQPPSPEDGENKAIASLRRRLKGKPITPHG